MKTFLERLIRRRNPLFQFDPALTEAQIITFVGQQCIQWIRAHKLLLRGRRPHWMLMDKEVRIQYLSACKWGKFVRLGRQVHINALGHEGVSLGEGTGIGAGSRLVVSASFNHLGKYIRIGHHVGIGEFAYLGGAGGLTIGNECIIGQYFSCHPENHICDELDQPIRRQGVTRKGISIGNNCWIGSKVTILDGVHIGDGCVIAAGAVVTQSFPPNSVIGGVPAKLIRNRGDKKIAPLRAVAIR